jgi:hypothetical protein
MRKMIANARKEMGFDNGKAQKNLNDYTKKKTRAK